MRMLGVNPDTLRIMGILLRSIKDWDRVECEGNGKRVRVVGKVAAFADGRTGLESISCTELGAWVPAKNLSKGFELCEPPFMRFSA